MRREGRLFTEGYRKMKLKAVSGIMLTLLFMGILSLTFEIQPVEAPYPIIYIKADGSIDPATANITSSDNVTYTFTADINASIVVEKNNTVVDGAGYTVQGTGSGTGIDSSYRNNVTLKNVEATNFYNGIYLFYSSNNTLSGNTVSNNSFGIRLFGSHNNLLSGNTATNNTDGIFLGSSRNNVLSGNTATNNMDGIFLAGSSNNNVLSGNTATNNRDGIALGGSSNNNVLSGNTATNNTSAGIVFGGCSNNVFSGNTFSSNIGDGILVFGITNNTFKDNIVSSNIGNGISIFGSTNNTYTANTVSSNNGYGICLSYLVSDPSSNNRFYHNNFIDNVAFVQAGLTNIWDDGYPSGGNYWSDHVCTGNPSDGSQPYIIDENNIDHYPFQDPNGWLLPPKPVGGKATPISMPMTELQIPWIWLTTIILSLVLTVVYVKKRKRNTEINS